VQCTSDIYRAAVNILTIFVISNNPEACHHRFLIGFMWFAERTMFSPRQRMIFVRAKVCFRGGNSQILR
jgi:hypothetical protein